MKLAWAPKPATRGRRLRNDPIAADEDHWDGIGLHGAEGSFTNVTVRALTRPPPVTELILIEELRAALPTREGIVVGDRCQRIINNNPVHGMKLSYVDRRPERSLRCSCSPGAPTAARP